MPPVTPLLVVLPLFAILAHVVWTDLSARRIANRAVLAVLALVPLQLVVLGKPEPWWTAPLAGGLVLLLGLGLWQLRWVGGGDVKLAAALSALVGLEHLLAFWLVVGLAGGALALLVVLLDRVREPLAVAAARVLPLPAAGRIAASLLPDPTGRPASVPYGLALAVGGLWWAGLLLGTS